jgi:hypothetical protein
LGVTSVPLQSITSRTLQEKRLRSARLVQRSARSAFRRLEGAQYQ